MGEGGKKKETQQERERGRKKKWLPFYAFDFQAVREHPPIASRQAGWQAGRQAKDIKTIGRCRDLPPSPSVPFKICKYTSEVRIYSSLSNRARLLFTRLELDSTA